MLVGVRNIDKEIRAQAKEGKGAEVYNHIATALARRYEVIYYAYLSLMSELDEKIKSGEDAEANDVFRRADDAMYKNKNELKGLQ